MRANRGALGVAAAVATELLYGCSFVFTKDAVETISPAALLAWRFSVALGAMGVLLATRVVRLTLTRHSLRPLLLPDGFEGMPLRKSFQLAARASKPWPGGKEPGEGPGAARRRMAPPGVPDPATWGNRDPALPPAAADEIAASVAGGRVRRRR